jgi:hypothetical protein
MSLQKWVEFGWLRAHQSSRREIAGLLSIVDRDLKDAREQVISPDWRLGIAYNAALKLCTVVLHASGYRAGRDLQHKRTIDALPLILGANRKDDAAYLDACRIKRNEIEYDTAGGATDSEAGELLQFATTLRDEVLGWLKTNRPELLGP